MNQLKEFTELEIIKVESKPRPEYNEANVPYFCEHSAKTCSYSGYGRIIKIGNGFTLVDIGLNKEEHYHCTSVQTDSSLMTLVNRWGVKRIKGKIILYVGDINE